MRSSAFDKHFGGGASAVSGVVTGPESVPGFAESFEHADTNIGLANASNTATCLYVIEEPRTKPVDRFGTLGTV
jgi:hypothetical protein